MPAEVSVKIIWNLMPTTQYVWELTPYLKKISEWTHTEVLSV